MGTHAIRSLHGFERHHMDVGVVCGACGRQAVFALKDVLLYCAAHRIPTGLPFVNGPFRCRCGSREVTIAPVPIVVRPQPLPPRLVPIYWTRKGPPTSPRG